MRTQQRTSTTSEFRPGLYPDQFDVDERLQQALNVTVTQASERMWVDIEVPNGTIAADRSKFTPIQEAYYQANQHMECGDWATTVVALHKVLDLNPELPFLQGVYTMLGIAHYRKGDLEAAATALEKAVELDNADETARHLLGAVYMLTGRLTDAISAFERVIKLGRREPHAHFYLGHIYEKQECWERAEQEYEKAVELQKEFVEAHEALAKLHFNIGEQSDPPERERRFLKAIESFGRMAEALPGNEARAYVHNQIGYLYGQLEKLDPSLDAYERAVQEKPDHVIALANLGTAYLAAERHADARATFGRLIEFGEDAVRNQLARVESPNFDTDVRMFMAEIYQKLGAAIAQTYEAELQATDGQSAESGLLDEGEVAFKTALDFVPDYAPAHGGLGIIYFRRGNFRLAAKSFKETLAIDPTDEGTRQNIRNMSTQVRDAVRKAVWARMIEPEDASGFYTGDFADKVDQTLSELLGDDEELREEVFTPEDLVQALMPIMNQIEEPQARFDIAARIFDCGLLSSGKAACLAGVDRVAFLMNLHEVGVTTLNLDEEKMELQPINVDSAVALLQSWVIEDTHEQQEQRETWEYLKKALDEDRLSDRKLFA